MGKALAAVAAAALFGVPGVGWADGAATYVARCSVCHQAGGVGQPGAYPRLAGRAPKLASRPEGRRVMISAVLYGMAGRLEVDGQALIGVMPGFPQLSDRDLAEVLTHVAGLGAKPAPAFSVDEVAAVRAGPGLSPGAVNALARALK